MGEAGGCFQNRPIKENKISLNMSTACLFTKIDAPYGRKQLKETWFSNAIMTSIKRKQKLFKTHFLSNDQDRIKKYKLYSNKLNKVKELAKKNYFREQFGLHKNNLKTAWKLTGMLVNKKSNSQVTIKKLIYDNKCYTHKVSIARQLNNYSINVGHGSNLLYYHFNRALCFAVFVLKRFTMSL